ncbi:hypothetical protein TRFO_38113 [Tritrichomonas foetus]|uniref:Myb-like DNA-binding domain containing protein n=1 Tax=Tritrichomonas foetus TaxID=1144522 RepID=A0A1J4J998_9EUKA|nr:hypothetical protein TRFO_38113 [Tritrichomonas foetus]|eukprot:OHS95758.1 hypothetical protein TRFO_38113 [Tritrichomonas foetus]
MQSQLEMIHNNRNMKEQLSFPPHLAIQKFKEKPKARMHRTLFTEEEDRLLSLIMETQPFHNWTEVSKHFTNRNARQCRDRWTNYLNQDINNGPWSPEEDQMLATLYNQYGPKWATISKFFDKRRENNVKNRWYSDLRSSIIVLENGNARFQGHPIINCHTGKRSSANSSSKKQNRVQVNQKNITPLTSPLNQMNNNMNGFIQMNMANPPMSNVICVNTFDNFCPNYPMNCMNRCINSIPEVLPNVVATASDVILNSCNVSSCEYSSESSDCADSENDNENCSEEEAFSESETDAECESKVTENADSIHDVDVHKKNEVETIETQFDNSLFEIWNSDEDELFYQEVNLCRVNEKTISIW